MQMANSIVWPDTSPIIRLTKNISKQQIPIAFLRWCTGPGESVEDTHNAPSDITIPCFNKPNVLKVNAGKIMPAVILIPSETNLPFKKLSYDRAIFIITK